MAASFRFLKCMSDAGWVLGIGDALRARGSSAAVLMLDPTAALAGGCAPPLVRVRVNSRSVILELRAHDASKCTRGRWAELEREDTPRSAAAWGKLLRWWAGEVAEFHAGRTPWSLPELRAGDGNRCRTRVDADRHEPTPHGGVGRGRKGRDLPGGTAVLGYSPATGNGCCTHTGPSAPAGTLGSDVEARETRREADEALWFKSITDTQRVRKLFR
jgi:hypothetical protein